MSNNFSLDKIEEVMKNNEFGGHGFFPVGKNNLWHSGIHLNYGENEGAYPILGGDLVAYRLNEDEITCSLSEKISPSTYADGIRVREQGREYLQNSITSYFSEKKGVITKYHERLDNSDIKFLARSSNYILLRHCIYTKQDEKKYFYSLYMHLTPYGKFLIKNDYCIYLTETKIPKHKPTFNNVKKDGNFYVRFDLMKNKDVQPFYLKWNILLENVSHSVWSLKYNNQNILPFSNITLNESEYFKSSFSESPEGLLVTIKNDDVKIKSEHIKWNENTLTLKLVKEKKAFLYTNEDDINNLKPGLFTENYDLTFSFENKSDNRILTRKKLKIEKEADGTKEKRDSRNIFYIGFVPNAYCEESSQKVQIQKNCYLRYPQAISENPKDLYKIDITNKIIYFNKNYVQYPMGSIGYDVYFPTGTVELKAGNNEIVDNSNELFQVSVAEYNIFVYEKDLIDNGNETYTVNSSLTKPIYIIDNGEKFKDLRIYFPNEQEEDKTPDYLISTKDIIFNNGNALLGKTFKGSKGKNGKVFTENTGREKLNYVRLTFENSNSKFYLYKDVFNGKRKNNKDLTENNKSWQLSLDWDNIKNLKDKALDDRITAKVFKKEFAETEYFISNPDNEWTINNVDLSDLPNEAVEDNDNLVKIYGMKKNKRLSATQEVSIFDVCNGEEKYKALWEEIAKEKDIIKCVCVDYQGNDEVYVDEDFLEFKSKLTGIVREKHDQSSDYKEVKNSVLCFASDSTSNTPLKLYDLNGLKNEELKAIPKLKGNKFLELQTGESSFCLYFDNDSLKEDKIFVGNKFDESYGKSNEFEEKSVTTISHRDCLGTAGGFITDKNFIHYSLFTSNEIEKVDFGYTLFDDNLNYYKLEKEEAKKSYKIALPSNPVIFKIRNDLSISDASDKFYEVSIDELTFYMNENDFQKNEKGNSITINKTINHSIYFFENKNSMNLSVLAIESFGYKKTLPEPLLKMQENFFNDGRLLFGKKIDNFENKADKDNGYTNWYKVKVGNDNYKFIVKFGDYLKEDEEIKKILRKAEYNPDKNVYVIDVSKKFDLQVYSSPECHKVIKANIKDEQKNASMLKTYAPIEFPIFERNPIVEEVIVNNNGKYEKRKYYGFCANQEKYFVDEKTYNKIHRNTLKLEDFFFVHPEAKEKSLDLNFKEDFFNKVIDELGNNNKKLEDLDVKKFLEAKDIYNQSLYPKNNNTVALYDTVLTYIRSACCKIPLEWDISLYSDDEYNKFWKDHGFMKEEYKVYQEIMEQTDIKQTLNKCSEFKNLDNYIFYNPGYFLGKLNEWGMLEINPYAIKEGLAPRHPDALIKPEYLDHHHSKIKVLSNPGFAPASSSNSDSERFPYEYNGLYYGALNWCYYCSIYPNVVESHNQHTGVDLAGTEGTPIYSFIQGEVWATSFMGNTINGFKNGGRSYGRMMLIKGNNNRLYLLGHLSAYNKKKGEPVRPGDIVAYVGNTGASVGAHLHLEVFECDNNLVRKDVISTEASTTIEMKWNNKFNHRSKRVNPFNHSEHKE